MKAKNQKLINYDFLSICIHAQKVVHSFFLSRHERNAEYITKEAGIFKKILEINSKYIILAGKFQRNNLP